MQCIQRYTACCSWEQPIIVESILITVTQFGAAPDMPTDVVCMSLQKQGVHSSYIYIYTASPLDKDNT